MSAQPSSPPLSALRADAIARHTRRFHQVKCKSFSIRGFLQDISALVKAMLSQPGVLSNENMQVPCLAADNKAENILVAPAWTVRPDNPTHAVFVRLGQAQFAQLGMDGVVATDETNSIEYRHYQCTGQLKLEVRSPSAEIVMQMTDQLFVMLEGTKHKWMATLNLTRFNVVGISDLRDSGAAGNQRYEQLIDINFSANVIVQDISESLPFEHFKINITGEAP